MQETPCARPVFGMNANPGIDKRADEPAPHGPLMVSGIAGTQIAPVFCLVIGMPRRQGPQTYGGQQPIGDHLQYRRPTVFCEHGIGERKREELVGPASRVVAALALALALAIDDIVEISAVGVPETFIERAIRRGRRVGRFPPRAVRLVPLAASLPGDAARCTRER